MNRPSYKELLFDERKDREEQLRWIKDAVNGSAKFYREPPYSYEEELAREIMQMHVRIAELEQAVGLITTLKPTMVMDADHPLEMAKEVTEYVNTRIAELKEYISQLIEIGNRFDDGYEHYSFAEQTPALVKFRRLVRNWKEG